MPPRDLSLSADERKAFNYLFDRADTDQLGVLTGDKAVGFFEGAQLPGQTLGEIWALSDDENTGFLTKEAFQGACRLIGYAQHGQTPTLELMKKPGGPLPYFRNVTIPGLAKQPAPPPPKSLSATPTGTPSRQMSASAGPSAASTPPTTGLTITPQDKAKYTRLFYNSGPTNGLLEGDKASEILAKSRLSNDQLSQIWNLSDTQARGALDATDFVIAMALINGTMSGTLAKLPDTLPVSVYAQAASGGAPAPAAAAGTTSPMPTSPLRPQGTGLGARPVQPLYPQSTGSSGIISNQNSLNRSTMSQSGGTPFGQQGQAGGGAWSISALEKSQSDTFYNMLDTTNQGFISGDVAVPFFVQSGLPEETLAAIWDLADIQKEGRLNRDEFAVARRLIMDCLAGQPVPSELDRDMVPPSLRGKVVNPPPGQSEVQRDLFSLLDDDEPPASLPPAAASAFNPVQPAASTSRVTSPAPILPTPTGGSSRQIPAPIVPTPTGGSARLAHTRSPPPPVPASRSNSTILSPTSTATTASAAPAASNAGSTGGRGNDFFDATPTEEEGDKISAHSAELGNLQNQVGSTRQSVSTLREQRTALANKVGDIETQIAELKVELSQAKAAYDVESTNMTNLEARQKSGSEELKSLKEQVIRAQSDLSGLRESKIELEQAILKDKEETRDLKAKLKTHNDEIASLKEAIEKVKKEARQTKGTAVVTKKQVSTAEAEKERLHKSLQDEREAAAATASADAPASQTTEEARGVPLPASSVVSPALSTTSARSTNPFERLGAFTPPIAAAVAGAGAGVAGLGVAAASAAHRAPSPLAASTSANEYDDAFAVPPATSDSAPPAPSPRVHRVAPPIPARRHQEEDPFGAPISSDTPTTAPSQASAGGFGFDDDFGNESFGAPSSTQEPVATVVDALRGSDGAPTSSATSQSQQQQQQQQPAGPRAMPSSDFDSAFAEFDEPADGRSGVIDQQQQQHGLPPPPEPSQVLAPQDGIGNQLTSSIDKGFDDDFGGAPATSAGPGAGAGAAAIAGFGAAAAGGAALLHHHDKQEGSGDHDDRDGEVSPPSATEPYTSREAGEEGDVFDDNARDDDSLDGDADLPPIQDIERPDSDSDQDQEEGDEGDRTAHQDIAGVAASTATATAAAPAASAEGEAVAPEHTLASSSRATYLGDQKDGDDIYEKRDTSTEQTEATSDEPAAVRPTPSDPFPGAFPGSTSAPPSSIGGDSDDFEDAATHHPTEDSLPPPTATSNDGAEGLTGAHSTQDGQAPDASGPTALLASETEPVSREPSGATGEDTATSPFETVAGSGSSPAEPVAGGEHGQTVSESRPSSLAAIPAAAAAASSSAEEGALHTDKGQAETETSVPHGGPGERPLDVLPSSQAPAVVTQDVQEPTSVSEPATTQSPAAAANATSHDDFDDDFEDLAPARIEEADDVGNVSNAPASATEAISSKQPDFNDNFDDDFGFDNQTFSHHTITSSGVGKVTEPAGLSGVGAGGPALSAGNNNDNSGGIGFDDEFDEAFAVPNAASSSATQASSSAAVADGQTQQLPKSVSGFDDDFFNAPLPASSTSAVASSTGAAAIQQAGPPKDAAAPPALPQRAAVPPGPHSSDPPMYEAPPGPPPSSDNRQGPTPSQAQAQQQGPVPELAGAPPLPQRNESAAGDPVQELVAMGFEKHQAISALEDNQYNIERAANALLAVNQ